MFSREKKALIDLASVLSKEIPILKVIAFGSRVRGDFKEDSDFDVFVLLEKKDRYLKERIIDIFYSYEMRSGIPFSVTILSKNEFDINDSLGSPFIKSIKENGVLIYDSQHRGKEVSIKV